MVDFDTILENAKNFAENIFASDSSGHDLAHTLRVCRMAERIALQEGANVPLVKLAALLHDVDDHKLSPDTADTKSRAAAFLQSQGMDVETAKTVLRIIGQVSFSRNTLPPDTLEGNCVQDADRLDAMGAIGIARTFAYGGAHGRPIYAPGDDRCSIAHFHEKLLLLKDRMNTATGKALALERDRFLRTYLETFLSEWNDEG